MAETDRPAAEKFTGKLSADAMRLARFKASLSRFSGGQSTVEKMDTHEGERRGPFVEMMQRQVAVLNLTPPQASTFGEYSARATRVARRDFGVVFISLEGG